MKMKRIISLFTAAVMMTGLLAGCSKGAEEKKDKGAKGRYVESEVALPEGAGDPIGILWKENKLVLYTLLTEGGGYQSYAYEKGAWDEPQAEAWLTDGLNQMRLETSFIYQGRDGITYGLALPADEDAVYGYHILAERDGTAADVTPETLFKTDENGMAANIVDMTVLKDGTIGIGNMKNSMVEFYRDGENVFSVEGISISTDHQTMLSAADETVAILGSDGKSIDFYGADDYKKKNSVPVDQKLMDSMLMPGKPGIWYLVNEKGIHRITEEGSILETILDGGSGMMSSDSARLRSFVAGESEELYGLYKTSAQEWKLKKYAFDENTAAVQDTTLSIYGLKESQSVTQAVYDFQSAHPEVKVEYNTAVKEGEIPTSDHIRTLNTELLNGSGADVLILDGLPMQSYMKKGILSDLSDMTEKLSKEGVLVDVIGNTAQMDGKVYALPARIGVPVIFGSEAEVNACQSLDALTSYTAQYPEGRLFGKSLHELIGMTLFHTMYDEMLKESGGLDEVKLTQFLNDWMQICESSGTRSFEAAMDMSSGLWQQMDVSFGTGEFYIGENFAAVAELQSLGSTMSVYTKARENAQVPASLKGYYVPRVIAGVNASSKQQDLAKEFAAGLFKESVQKSDNYDGFPVLKQALEFMEEYVDTEEARDSLIGSSTTDPETGETYEMHSGYPTRQEVEGLVTMIEGLRTPYIADRVISETVLQEMESCYTNAQSPEVTAQAICQKVDTYLSE